MQQQLSAGAAAVAAVSTPRRTRHPSVLQRASFFQDQFEDASEEQPPAAAVEPARETDLEAADLVFEHPSGVHVCVFGVEHLERQPHIGELIGG